MNGALSFAEFFRALWGEDAFPWQTALARHVLANEWPASIDPPTGAGKTALIDLGLYLLTFPERKARAPRRIFYVVDRRVIVDEAHERAVEIAEKIQAANSGVLAAIKSRLIELGGHSEQPLQVSVMRGGLPRDVAWARSPAQPAVIVTTVDQLGSRLLFRGYGVSDGMKPIHAGLAAIDSLVLLDEAHLSHAFAKTLERLRQYASAEWRGQTASALPPPMQVVQMTATPGSPVAFPFRRTYEENEVPSAILDRRLEARKYVELREVPTGHPPKKAQGEKAQRDWQRRQSERLEELAAAAATEAWALVEKTDDRVVGVIVNRVHTARRVADILAQKIRDAALDAEVALFIGRSRPMEREALYQKYRARVRAGRVRNETDKPLFIVATQCVEAGANLDFDALVTECASLDALRQRFGRLDRFGDITERHGFARAIVLVRSDQLKEGPTLEPDAVYGAALDATWHYLRRFEKQAQSGQRKRKNAAADASAPALLDLGIAGFAQFTRKEPPSVELLSPRTEPPTLLPAHLDLLCQTSPRSTPDPDPAPFLHGPASAPADVQIAWRADLSVERPEGWADTVALLPPSSPEMLSVPPWAAKAWLSSSADAANLNDTEGPNESGAVRTDGESRKALCWFGAGKPGTRVIDSDEIFPGSVLVVPASYGGCDRFGWNPDQRQQAPRDFGDLAFTRQRARPALRLHPDIIDSWRADEMNAEAFAEWKQRIVRRLTTLLADATEAEEPLAFGSLRELVREVSSCALVSPGIREIATGLLDRGLKNSPVYAGGRGVLLIGRKPPQAELRLELLEEEDLSLGLDQISLLRHTEDVLGIVRALAARCGFDSELMTTFEAAARCHDLGKSDRRFQGLLHGDRVSALTGEPLAKSILDYPTTRERSAAWKRAGLPDGWRHEMHSLDFMREHFKTLLPAGTRADLARHLVAIHHGYGRAIAPPVHDLSASNSIAQAVGFSEQFAVAAGQRCRWSRLDSGLTSQFWKLNREFGWFGLAYLEAVFRLADHLASAHEETIAAPAQ